MKAEYKSVAKLATRYTTDDRITIAAEKSNLRDADVKFNNLVETMSSELIVSMLSYRLLLNDLTSNQPFRKLDREGEDLLTPAWKKEAISTLRKKIEAFELLSAYDFKQKYLLDILKHYGYVNWMLSRDLKVGRVVGSDFVDVEYTSEDPFLSAFAVNTLCEETIRYDNYLGANRANQSVKFFAGLLDEKRKILAEKTQALDEFRRSAQTYIRTGGAKNPPQNTIDPEEKRATIVSNIYRLRLSLESIDRRLKNMVKPEHLNDINENIVSIRRKIDDINASPNGKDAASQKKLRELSDQLQVELTMLDAARSPAQGKTKAELITEKEEKEIELSVAQSDLRAIEAQIWTLHQNVSSESAYDAMQRQVEKASDEYLEVLDRYNVEKSKSLITSPLQLAIRGEPNEYPEFPKRYLVIALAWITSLLICAFIIIVAEYADTRIRTPEHLRRQSKLPVIAVIDHIDSKNLNLNDLFASHKKKEGLDSFKSHLRKLRYEIERTQGQVILVTSTKEGQGKTFIVLCLAYLLAMLKKRILIIDTNFHRNSVTQMLQRKTNSQNGNKNGQNKASAESTTVVPAAGINIADEYPKVFGRSTRLFGDPLRIEGVGNSGCAASPAEVFADKDFNQTLQALRENYDYIIMEGPALNEYSDSRELAIYADKVVPVFSAESVIQSSDRSSIEFLKSLDGKLAGAVLNKVNDSDILIQD